MQSRRVGFSDALLSGIVLLKRNVSEFALKNQLNSETKQWLMMVLSSKFATLTPNNNQLLSNRARRSGMQRAFAFDPLGGRAS